jgi:hypothetical protein
VQGYKIIVVLIFLFFYVNNAHAYLDPGIGSYVFQVLIATFIGGLVTIKMFWQKIRSFFTKHGTRKQDK